MGTGGSSGPADGRFEKLPASATGIDFVHRYDLGRLAERKFLNTPFAGGGVAIGDYDADGLPDVLLTRAHGGARLYRNRGGFRFEDVSRAAGLKLDTPFTAGCTFADIDNDGLLDIYICVFDQPNQLYINNGDGTFVEKASELGLSYWGASMMMAFADYDLDGDLDGYLLTNRYFRNAARVPDFEPVFDEATGRHVVPREVRERFDVIRRPDGVAVPVRAGEFDHLYRNDGGRFTEVSSAAGIDGNFPGIGVVWWDYNSDGLPDLYAANDYNAPDQLYRNNGDGTFDEVIGEVVPYTPWFSMGVDAGDFNNDGLPDLLASDMAGTTHLKEKLSMGAMDQNGWFLEYPTPRQYMRNMLYLNTGTGTMQEVAYLAGLARSDWTWSVRFADFDADGWQDVYVTNGMSRNFADSDMPVRHGNAVGNINTWLPEPVLKDVNMAFRNRGGFRFEEVGERWGLDLAEACFGAATGDLDGDGDLDIVAVGFDCEVAVYRNRLRSGRCATIALAGLLSNRSGIGATVTAESAVGTQTRTLTLARGFASSDEPVAHFGFGDAETIDRLVVRWPSGLSQTFTDLPTGWHYTITEAGTNAPVEEPAPPPAWYADVEAVGAIRHLERTFDDFERQPLLPNRLSQLGPGLAMGDVDGDGLDDLFVGGAAGQPGRIFLIGRGGEFKPHPFRFEAAPEDMGALFFDADADGDTDLYVVSGGVECEPGDPVLRDRLYLNDGDGGFSRGELPDLRDSGSVVCAADFDRDGDLDLFVGARSVPGRYPSPPSSRLLVNEGGRFRAAGPDRAPGLRDCGMVTSALWSDANGDGLVDLLVTAEYEPLRVFVNNPASGKLEVPGGETGLEGLSGWWNGIAGADVDGDGDIDYAVTNFGLNTKYGQPGADKPQVLYYLDPSGDGGANVIEAKVAGDCLLPVRGRSCSTLAIPELAEKFKSYRAFASAALDEIYSPQALGSSLKKTAAELRSGILLNESAGGELRFTFRPLPTMAQVAPGFGVAFCEADGDGVPDLFVAQNFFGAQRETGWMAGGLSCVMTGDGSGGFRPVEARHSGVAITGDAVAAVVADIDHDLLPDILCSVNNSGLKTFRNLRPDLRGYSIKLVGRPGNSLAAGAKVTVTGVGGRRQDFEIHAGGGYLAQGPGAVSVVWAGDVPERVDVRWPCGVTTSSEFPQGYRKIQIVEPEQG